MTEWSQSKWYQVAADFYKDDQNKILDLLKEKPKGKLLDIGCNDGDFAIKAQKKAKTHAYGIEIDKELAKEASSKGINVTISDANEKLPYVDGYFDIIISNQVIEHLQNIDNFFKEINRVLKDEGYAIISTVNISSLHNILMIIFGMQPFSFHVSEIQVGNHHGFKVKKTFGTGYYFIPRSLSKILSRLSSRYCIYIGILIEKF